MKKIIMCGVTVLVVALLAAQFVQAQGMIYLSNLGASSTGASYVGSDSWCAASFFTGTNAGGYALNSIQLKMTDGSGNPNGFTVMLYSAVHIADYFPGSSLRTLNGSLNPVTSGIYTYTPAANLTLSAQTAYFIVLTAETAVADGAYEWSLTRTSSYNPSGGWQAPLVVGAVDNFQSSDGSSWTPSLLGLPQFAITATVVPEPRVLSLFGLLGLGFLWHRRRLR
jgi:hypothetical protein